MSSCKIIPTIKLPNGQEVNSQLFTSLYVDNKLPRSKALEIYFSTFLPNFKDASWISARKDWLSGKYKTLEEAQKANGVTIQTDKNGEPTIEAISDILKKYGLNISSSIKPGVEELFESNPELANEVYEALGFKSFNVFRGFGGIRNLSKGLDKLGKFYSTSKLVAGLYSKQKEVKDKYGSYQTPDESFIEETNVFIKNPFIISADEWDNYSWITKLIDKDVTNKYNDWSEFPDDIVKEVKDKLLSLGYDSIIVNEDEKRSFRERFNENTGKYEKYPIQSDYHGKQIIVLNSSQQKQQAQQLYSQYLDSKNINIEQGNLRQQIKNIANNSQYEHNKRLAEFLLDYNFGKNDFFRFAEDFAEDFEEFGLYYKDEKGVKNISIKANKIAKEIPLNSRQYFEEQVLLHETIHLLTVDNLNKNKEIKNKISNLMQVAKSKIDISKYSNAFSSEAEFVAHAFSDYNFQKELKSIPYEKSNVWNKFISLIQDMAKYLGINVENSLLEKIVEVSEPLFNNILESKQDVEGFKNWKKSPQYNLTEAAPVNDEVKNILNRFSYNFNMGANLSDTNKTRQQENVIRQINNEYKTVEAKINWNGTIRLFVKNTDIPYELKDRTITDPRVDDIINRMKDKFPNTIIEKTTFKEANKTYKNLDPRATSFIIGNKIVILTDRVSGESTVEEFLHPFTLAIYNRNPELFENLLEEAKGNYPKLVKDIKSNYKRYGQKTVDLEIVTQALSKALHKEYEINDTQSVSQLKKLVDKFFSYLNELLDLIVSDGNRVYSDMLKPTTSISDLVKLLNTEGLTFETAYDYGNNYYNLNQTSAFVNQTLSRDDLTNQAKSTIDKIFKLNSKVKYDEVEGVYINIITGETFTRLSDFKKGFKYKDTEGYFEFGGNEDDFADNRQWGNIIDEIFNRIIIGESKEQTKNSWKKKTLLTNYESEADITEDVFDTAYEKLDAFVKEYNEKGIILLPQIIISNNEKNVAGRTDITAVFPDGSIKIIDLKTTITPPKSPAYYKVYPTEKGNRASKDETYRFQLSGYKAMFQSQGFIMNEEPTSNLFFTIVNNEDGIVNKVNFNGEIEQNSLQEVVEALNFDKNYKGETFINSPEQVKEGKTILDKVRIILQNRIKLIENQPHLKNQRYKLYQTEKLKSDLSGVEAIKGIETFINDTFNLFFNKLNNTTGNYTKGLLEEIKDELKNPEDNISKLNNLLYYKSLLEGYSGIFSDLSYFYREMVKINPSEIKPGSSYDKLRTIISEENTIKKFYLEKIPDMIATIYAKNVSESLNQDIKEQYKTEAARIDKRKEEGKSTARVEKRLQFIENKYITENGITKETIAQMLKEGSNEDIPLIDMWLTPAISSSNPVVALFAKTLKTYLENARLKSFDFAHAAEKALKDYRGTNSSNNPAEFNKDFYELVTEYNIEGKEVKRYQFISPVDQNAYNKARYDFFQSIKDVKEGRNELIREWFSKNNQALPKESLKINGVTIVKGRDEILREKKNLVSEGIWSQGDYDFWFNGQVIQDEDGNIEAYIGELSAPNLKIYGSSKYNELQKNPSKKKYYDFLVASYFKSQENYPEDSRPGFVIPSISKNNNDRLRENGVVKYLKYKWKEGTKVLEQDQDYNMEKVSSDMKIIPSYFTQYMNPEDVSLDLISSIMLFNDASLRYGVQSKLVGLAESTLSSVKENAPYKVDTLGTKFIDEAAKKAGVYDTYLKYKKKHNGNNIAALLESFIDMQIYNNQNVAHPINTFIGEIDLNKLAGSLMSWTSTTQLGGLNIMGALANNMINEISVNIESATNQYFNSKDMALAEFTYDKHIGDYLKDFAEPINKSLIGQLIDIYDPMQGEFKDKYGRKVSHGVFKKLWSMDTHFFLMHQTDHRIQVKIMIAALQRTKVKQVINGQTKEISLFDAYEKDSNGKIKLKQGVKLDGNLSENGMVNQDVQNRIHALNKRIFGVYNKFDKVALEKYWYGKLVLMYRKHLIPGFKRRYKSIGTDQELGMVTEGYYNTVVRLLKTDIKELAKSIVSKDSTLSPMEKANAKKALRELMWIAATGALVLVLTAMSKAADDDEKRILAYPLYLALRLNADLGSYGTFGDPRSGFLPNIQEMIRTTKSPTPATAPIDRFIRIFSQLTDPFETYSRDSGIFKKGDSKLAAEFIRFFGVTGTTFNPDNAIDFIQRNNN